jgi:CubicO group peptidase (beta-lactamase class C family)
VGKARRLVAVAALMLASAAQAQSEAARIEALLKETLATQSVKAVIVKVTRRDEVVIRTAAGESMTGVPATPDMHVRNGAVAFAYVGTLLLRFVDQKRSRWTIRSSAGCRTSRTRTRSRSGC